jgi:hypothetical protein
MSLDNTAKDRHLVIAKIASMPDQSDMKFSLPGSPGLWGGDYTIIRSGSSFEYLWSSTILM